MNWQRIAGVLGGIAIGLGIFTFTYAKGGSYLTNDPAACANCHIMESQYEGWMKASHRRAAVCNDCHAPHDFVGKYSTKAINGFFHSWAFTTGWFPENLRINARNRRITEEACLHCHADITSSIRAIQGHQASESCLACHREVGHH